MHVACYRIASLVCTCLLHTFSLSWFSYRGEKNLNYRCVYDVKNLTCVKTELDWRKLKFKMERIRTNGKQHDSADVTFWIVATTDENWQARSDLSESVCS